MAASLCDFLTWSAGLSVPLEVKQTAHDFRLSKGALSQLAVLKKVEAAGATPFVLVYHSTLDKWRVAPIGYFEFGVPSWDMRSLPLFSSVQEAMSSTGVFPGEGL